MAARTDELIGFCEDFYGKIGPTMHKQDPERRAAMRKELNEYV